VRNQEKKMSLSTTASAMNSTEFSKIIQIVDDLEKSLNTDVNVIAVRQSSFEKKVDVDSLLRRIAKLESNDIETRSQVSDLKKSLEEANQHMSELKDQNDTLKNRFLSLSRSRTVKEEPESKKRKQESEEEYSETESENERERERELKILPKSSKKGAKSPIGDSELFDFERTVLFEDVEKFSKRNRQQLLTHLESFKNEISELCPECSEVDSKLLEKLFSEYTLTAPEQRQIQLDCWSIMTQDEPKGRGRPMASVGLHKRAKELFKSRKMSYRPDKKAKTSSSSSSSAGAGAGAGGSGPSGVFDENYEYDEYGFIMK
jgi:regulator of replication initiation timing